MQKVFKATRQDEVPQKENVNRKEEDLRRSTPTFRGQRDVKNQPKRLKKRSQ